MRYESHRIGLSLERSIGTHLSRGFADAFDFAARQVRAMSERDPDFFPIYTEKAAGGMTGEGWTDWCGGLSRRTDVASRRAVRRVRVAATRRALLATPRAQAARPATCTIWASSS